MSQWKASARDVLTPDALGMLQRIADSGSFAAAARASSMVPSALTYRVRQIEEALDVLLFDRSSRQARLTEAGRELVTEGKRLLSEIDSLANRVQRIATGWEPQLTLAVDGIIDRTTLLELCESFFALNPPTRLRIREETLSGTLVALTSGLTDLALGVVAEAAIPGIQMRPLGVQRFVFVVAPHHPLAKTPEPLGDQTIFQHRIVAVADSVQRGSGMTVGILEGQDVFTVPNLQAKVEAQLRGLGCGFLPEGLALPWIETGKLIAKRVERTERQLPVNYAWINVAKGAQGRALQWWLEQLRHHTTRQSLMRPRSSLSETLC